MVNHSVNFVDPKDKRVHTQKIESIWRVDKQKFNAMNGVDRKYLDSYLTEFTWRFTQNYNRMEIFEKLIQIIPKHFSKVLEEFAKFSFMIQFFIYS